MATISSLNILELLPACFSCNKIFFLSQGSLGSEGQKILYRKNQKQKSLNLVIYVVIEEFNLN